ncbi:MAG: hypothetical protein HPY57_01965 [Ignavibacteria bacterium]|nr:hypothetical protein [Ignavibacteria bacterium]
MKYYFLSFDEMKKQFKNILIGILILLFFIANVNFTVVLHYCDTMKQLSKSECGMCEEDHEAIYLNSFNLSINDISDDPCCKNIVKTTNQIDDVIVRKTEINELNQLQVAFLLPSIPELTTNTFEVQVTNTHSPPQKIPSYLINLILLI